MSRLAASHNLARLSPGRLSWLHTRWAAQASTQLGHAGSLALIYAWRRSYDAPTTAATALSYNVSLRRFGAIGVFVSDTRSGGALLSIGTTVYPYTVYGRIPAGQDSAAGTFMDTIVVTLNF